MVIPGNLYSILLERCHPQALVLWQQLNRLCSSVALKAAGIVIDTIIFSWLFVIRFDSTTLVSVTDVMLLPICSVF